MNYGFQPMTCLVSALFFSMHFMAAASSERVTIHSSFDRGSIGSLKEVKPNFFSGQTMHWIKKDGVGNQYYWFYFQVDNAKNKTLTFELTNLIGVYRGNPHVVYTDYTQPVVSDDNQTWRRISDVDYDETDHIFRFTHTFTSNTAWLAYVQPYPLARKIDYLASIKTNPLVHIETIGHSRQRRPIELLTIPAQGDPTNKKVLFFMGLQHPGEDSGAFLNRF